MSNEKVERIIQSIKSGDQSLTHLKDPWSFMVEDIKQLAPYFPKSHIASLEIMRVDSAEDMVNIAPFITSAPIQHLTLKATDEAVKALVPFLVDSSLQSLKFVRGHSYVGYDAILALAKSVAESDITELSLTQSNSRNGCLGSIVPVMEAIKKSKVTCLTIENGHRVFKDLAKLGQFLLGSKITSLDLSNNELTVADMQVLMPYLSKSPVKDLRLSGNRFGDQGMVILSRFLTVSKLERLTITNSINGSNNIGKEGVCALVQQLANSRLVCLNLHNNDIDDEALVAIGSVLADTKLEVLDVGCNKITAAGIKAFAPMILNSKLRRLNIGWNNLGNDGLAFIAGILNQTNITSLDISKIQLTQNGLRPLIDILNQSALIELYVSENKIDDEDVQHLALAITGSRLLVLEMKSIYFGMKSVKYLARALPLTDIIKFLSDVQNHNFISAYKNCLPFTNLSWVNFNSNRPRYPDELEQLPKYIVRSGVTCVGFHYMEDCHHLGAAINNNQRISDMLFGLCQDKTITEFKEAVKKFPKFVFGYENFNWASNYNPDYTGNTLLHIAAKGQLQALKAIKSVISASVFKRMLMLMNADDKSALDIANESFDSACVRFIESALEMNSVAVSVDSKALFESCSVPLQDIIGRVNRGERVTEVDFSVQHTCIDDLQALAAVLPHSSIAELNFNDAEVTAEMLAVLVSVLPKSSVTRLTFRNSNLCDDSLNVLSDIICHSNIEFIDLYGNGNISQTSWGKFFSAIGRSHLQGIDFGRCLGTIKFDVLAENLKDSSITYLNLSGNDLTDSGVMRLASFLPKNLSKLVLSWNKITSVGFEELAKYLSHTSMVCLDASYNDIDSEGLVQIADFLPSSSITYLMLRNNNLNAIGVREIFAATKNSSLVEVDFHVSAGVGLKETSDVNNLEIANIDDLLSDSHLLCFNYHDGYAVTHYKNRSKTSQSKNHVPSTNIELKKQCYEAYVKNDVTELENCFKKLPSLLYVIFPEENNSSLLHCAVKLQNLKLCFLLKKLMKPSLYQAYLNLRNSQGKSPLDLARENGNEMLLDWLKNELGQSAVQLTSTAKITTIVKPASEDNLVRKPSVRSWHFEFEQHADKLAQSREVYELLDASVNDIEKVIYSYQHHPVPGMDIQRIQVIYNPEMNRGFMSSLALLNRRSSKVAFKPKWKLEGWRGKVAEYAINLCSEYGDEDFPNVNVMPTWHGTTAAAVESICETGYANLATTDSGFFGKGVYAAHEAEYAYRVYSKGGPIVMNWNAFFLAYPVIHGDMEQLMGGSNFSNSDAHFVPVVPRSPHDTVNYIPTRANQKHQYTELVVFQASQCLPRYVVTLAKREVERPLVRISRHPLCFFNSGQPFDFLDAAQNVYDQYLVKDYSLQSYKVDWCYTHEGKNIARPNHGLAHTLSTALYVPYVVTYYIAQHEHYLSVTEKQLLRQSIPWIQLAMLFFVVGRENEAGSREDVTAYQRFRLNSAKAFEEYVKAQKFKIDEHFYLQLKNAIQRASFTDGYVGAIMKICHDIDTVRCQPAHIYAEICRPIQELVGAVVMEALKDLVLRSKLATGDRVLGNSSFQQGYQSALFLKCSANPEYCWQKLKKAESLWLEGESRLINNLQSKVEASIWLS